MKLKEKYRENSTYIAEYRAKRGRKKEKKRNGIQNESADARTRLPLILLSATTTNDDDDYSPVRSESFGTSMHIVCAHGLAAESLASTARDFVRKLEWALLFSRLLGEQERIPCTLWRICALWVYVTVGGHYV